MVRPRCNVCKKTVTIRQDALQCDTCDNWQHRLCETVNFDVHLPDTSEVYDQSTIVQLNNSSFTVSDEEDTTIHLNNLDQSFDITQRTFAEPDIITETSIQDDPLPDQLTDAIDQPTYSVVDGASQRGKRKLVDVDGYTYTVKAKSQARQDVFRSAGAIVETAILQHSDPSQPAGSRVKQSNLVRVVQRTKQKLRPDEPHDLEFELDLDFIPPGFLQRDSHVDSKRHLLFATTAQLTVLEKAQRWFIDGTFKIVAAPFYQLLSIHAFITANNCTKSVPLAFIVISRRCKIDYIPVFQALKDLLLPQSAVRGFVADFESGVWQALKEVFPGMMINGCLFHFTQAVFRHVQFLGLQPAYRQQDCIFKYVRKLMALPFLPADHIRPAFRRLKDLQTDPLQRLVTYVEDTWIKSTVWPVESWTVFSQPTRTNNDVEGWHRRINKKSSERKEALLLTTASKTERRSRTFTQSAEDGFRV
ncbi:Hypothetical predicted protein [Mytilus galloprovincialis]|uniref:MULE transposase domain-containing protein n=1 Tax=Mytilus galloprovincialis TaxID=29158 RepID=A0A8B6E5W3_MYTGA|nr:Hypothetical predicted protein [Mytilus galloprovincialis]